MCRYQNYEQIARIADKYYNDLKMCTLVALIAATGCSYGKAYNIYKKLGRKTRKGTHRVMQAKALDKFGYRLVHVPRFAKTLGKIADNAPKQGTYWIYSSRHVTCVVDGKVFDVPLRGSRKRVQCIYRVETA